MGVPVPAEAKAETAAAVPCAAPTPVPPAQRRDYRPRLPGHARHTGQVANCDVKAIDKRPFGLRDPSPIAADELRHPKEHTLQSSLLVGTVDLQLLVDLRRLSLSAVKVVQAPCMSISNLNAGTSCLDDSSAPGKRPSATRERPGGDQNCRY